MKKFELMKTYLNEKRDKATSINEISILSAIIDDDLPVLDRGRPGILIGWLASQANQKGMSEDQEKIYREVLHNLRKIFEGEG